MGKSTKRAAQRKNFRRRRDSIRPPSDKKKLFWGRRIHKCQIVSCGCAGYTKRYRLSSGGQAACLDRAVGQLYCAEIAAAVVRSVEIRARRGDRDRKRVGA